MNYVSQDLPFQII